MKKLIIVLSSVAGALLLFIAPAFVGGGEDTGETLSRENEISSLLGMLSEKDASLEALGSEAERLRDELTSLGDELESLKSDTSGADELALQEINRLKGEIASREAEIASLTSDADALRKEIEARDTAQNTAYTSLLASFTTSFNASDTARSTNIAVAARTVSGRIVMPGEELSFSAVVGECTVPKGYVESKVFYQGELTQGIGGGVCQVSTTLFNAALLSGMKITERHGHSMTVSYIAPGRDATFNYGYLDLKFVNTYSAPVKIVSDISGGKLTFSFYSALKAVKLPKITVDVTKDTDGNYCTTRYVNGVSDYYTTTAYKKK